jgi:signal transduction histidine kinase
MTSPDPVSLLVVDDRPENLLALQALLDAPDRRIVLANSGEAALRHLLTEEFAVILLDVQMPEMDGFETAQYIRSRRQSQYTPIVFLTASHAEERHVGRGYSLGAVDYLCKPIVPGILEAKVRGFTELFRLRRELAQSEQRLRETNAALEEGNRQLLFANEGLRTEIVERRRAEGEALQARAAADRASRVKSEFLAAMSHELRTPLNAIIGFSELLETETFGPLNERQKRYAESILTSGRHLLQLINDVLDLAKVEAGRMQLDLDPFDVPEALQNIQEIAQALAIKKRVTLDVSVDPDLPPLIADAAKFRQVLYNLLSNAIKFTPEGGSVRVRAQQGSGDGTGGDAGWLQIAVADTGVGIRPEDQDRIFGEFEQVDSSYSRQQQGTGLGLALTRRLVELHGGTIRVTSAGEGQGSTFYVRFPFEAPQAAPAGEPVAVPAAVRPSERERPLVLVVEDQPAAEELLCHYLSEAGYDTAVVARGDLAVSRARELQPDAITLDVMLPHRDGLQVLADLKASPDTREIPVVMVSVTENQELGVAMGAMDWLVKPVERTRLTEVLHRVTAARGSAPESVLVIDDEAAVREVLTETLKEQGYRVEAAAGGREGIALARKRRPDLVVLDLMMPEVTGFDVVRALRERPATREIPVVIYTAKDLTEEDQQVLSRHVTGIAAKSDGEDLLRELERMRLNRPAGAARG